MTQIRSIRPSGEPPSVPAPPRFVDRRTTYRREADRLAHRETVLLARSLDVLAAGGDAEGRLAGLLRLLADTAGARRAAVLAEGPDRRVAVHRDQDEPPAAAEALAAWLDAEAPRPRALRAAAGPAPAAVVVGPRGRGRTSAGSAAHFACLPVAGAGGVVLGFAFGARVDPEELAGRLPPQLARHAAVALALVTRQLASERELEALRARDAERSRFVSTVAHELRTPLTGLSGYLDLILDGNVDEALVERDFLERSRGIVATMGELVGDLLELSQLESGTLRLDVAPFSVAEVGSRVVHALEPIAMRRGVDLATSLPPRLRAALGDRRRVEQILTNLVANALKFGRPGTTVELAGWFDGSVAVLAVRDEGAGIAPGDRSRIFDRFYRMNGHERVTGTGLGLPIARDLARAMAGDLDVASVAEAGSSFVLVLPGPADSDEEIVAAVLARTLATEEVRLEEQSVLRALQAAGRSLPRPRLVPPPGSVAGPAFEDRLRPATLRAIDGHGARSKDPTPA